MKHITPLLFLLATLLIQSCNSDTVAGGSTTVEDGYIAVIVAYENTPVSTKVQLLPADFNPLTDSEKVIRQVFTDSIGHARFNSVAPGDYALLVIDDTIGNYRSGIHQNSDVEIELVKTGSLTIAVDYVDSLGIIGTPYVGKKDSESGTVTFTNIPEGDYSGVVADSVTAKVSIIVESEKVTDITIEQDHFIVEPMDLGDELSYFGAKQLAWGNSGTLWAASGSGGLFYHDKSKWEFIGALHGIPSNRHIYGVHSSVLIPDLAKSEQVLAYGDDMIYLYEDNIWYSLTMANPQFIDQTVLTGDMSSTGTAVLAYDDKIYYNIRRSDAWVPVELTGAISLYCDSDTLWAGTESGIVAIDLTGSVTELIADSFGKVHSIQKTVNDKLFAASDSGLVELYDGVWELRDGSPANLRLVTEDSSGSIWAIQQDSAIVKFNRVGEVSLYTNSELVSSISSIIGDTSGIRTANGINGINSIK